MQMHINATDGKEGFHGMGRNVACCSTKAIRWMWIFPEPSAGSGGNRTRRQGDTVSNVTKAAKLETGISVQVPIFVNEGDRIKVDTRTKEYLGRE